MIAAFAVVASAIVRLAPVGSRRRPHGEIAVMVRSICADARNRRGSMAMWRAGIEECLSLIVATAGLWMSPGGPGITSAPPRTSPKGSHMLQRLRHDLRLALRALNANRLTTGLAVLTLAIGIGVNTTVFSVLDATLFRPVPFRDADRLVNINNFNPKQGFRYYGLSPELLRLWRQQTDLFDRIEAIDRGSFVYDGAAGAEMVSGATVTPGIFAMLGVVPRAGRPFVEGDGRTGSERAVVVSNRFWRERLGGSSSAVGSTITLNGVRCQVLGVMSASFRFPNEGTDLWLPYDAAAPPETPVVQPRALDPWAHLAAGVTFDRANAEAIARGSRLSEAAGRGAATSAKIRKPAELGDSKTQRSLTALGGAVGFLLLIVCANLANLSLSRSLARARDYAVRTALGASRGDVIRETLVENLLVGGAGAALGVGTAWLLQQATLAVLPDTMISSSVNPIDLDARALVFTAGVGLLATVFFGLPPAIIASRTAVADALRFESRSATGSPASRRWRAALVIVEVGLSVVLLVGAALMTRSLMKLQSADRGFDTDSLISMHIALPAPAYSDEHEQRRFMTDLAGRFRRLPGVTGVTPGNTPAERDSINIGLLEFDHQPGVQTEQMFVGAREVVPGYFETLGVPIVDGHAFREGDPEDAIIVSRGFASKYWGSRSPVGARFRFAAGRTGGPEGDWRTVVGVAGNVRELTDSRGSSLALYYPEGTATGFFAASLPSSTIAAHKSMVIRVDSPASFVKPLASAVHALDPTVVVWKTDLVEHLFADAIARPRVVFLVMSTFAAFGLVLVAAGIYGVLSHLVSQRMRELGIRVALGATSRDIGRLVVGRGLALTLTGLVGGVLVAVPLVRLMRSLLYEVDPFDPLSIALVAALMIGVALLSTWRPARRAMRVNPASLLRAN